MSNYYDGIAAGYDRLHRAEQQRKLKTLVPLLDISPDFWFLDVGCGTGVSFPSINCAYKFGLDPAIELLKRVSTKSAHGCVINGQGERLPFRSANFDLTLCLTALHNFDNPADGLAEMRRVTKPEGTIVVTVLKRTSKTETVCKLIKSTLKVRQELDDMHDHMYICDNLPSETQEEQIEQ